MIWIWLFRCMAWVRSIFSTPVAFPRGSSRYIPPLDINAMCPACGHRKGKLICVAMKDQPIKIAVKRICQVCGASCFESTVLKDDAGTRIHPAM